MLARAAFPAFFLVLGGFIMFLLVTLSTPIIKTIYLLRIEYPGGSTAAKAGTLGICYTVRGGNDFFGGFDGCIGPDFGYTFDPTFIGVNINRESNKIIIKSLTGALLVFNALATGFAGISLFFGFFAWLCASRAMEIILFITLFFSAFMGWLAWALDCAMTLVARKRVSDDSLGALSGHIGNAFWLALAGALALSFGLCFAGCGMFGRYSRPRESTYVTRDTTTVAPAPVAAPVATEKPVGGRVWPWQRWRRNPEYRGTY